MGTCVADVKRLGPRFEPPRSKGRFMLLISGFLVHDPDRNPTKGGILTGTRWTRMPEVYDGLVHVATRFDSQEVYEPPS
jgi:hypothetical protein